MEMLKEKRKQHHYYVTSEEYKQIEDLAKRVGRTEASIVRDCVLAVASTPLLEYIFDDGVLLKADAKSLLKYSPTLRIIQEITKQLEAQGIQINVDELLTRQYRTSINTPTD